MGEGLGPGFVGCGSCALRHRLPLRSGRRPALRPRDHQDDRFAEAQGRRPAQSLFRQRHPHAEAGGARRTERRAHAEIQILPRQAAKEDEEAQMTIPRDRVPYSAIVDRPKLRLPAGKRVVVWTIVNLEVWDIAKPMARQVLPAPSGVSLLPDVPNWSWHEYGMRVGFWGFHALYERLRIWPTGAIHPRVCVDYPRVAQACKDSGWEFMGQPSPQGPIHNEK